MKAETLAALKAGVEKWDALAIVESRHDARIYAESCKLCELFLLKDCVGCPVFEQTGEEYCAQTPWEGARDALDLWIEQEVMGVSSFWTDSARIEFRAAAKAEADFLRSLIPEGAR